MKTVLVFKTSVSKKSHIQIIRPLLNSLVTKKGDWNFDLEDCDRILRVESQAIKREAICSILNNHGFLCEELD